MTGPVTRPFRGVSAEDRRRHRRATLLDACLDLAAADGMANVTIDAICARAGLTKRYFYESFPDRDAAFVALTDELFGGVLAALPPAPAGPGPAPPLRVRAHEAISAVIKYLTDDPRNARLYVEVTGTGLLQRTIDGGLRAVADILVDHVLAGRETSRSDRDRLGLAALVIVAGASHAVTGWLDGTVALSREELIDEIVMLVVAAARTVVSDA